ncbi:DUF3048 domain-containing protein [Evansella cellulosilytica]|uniref:DUF3048 domain-containing protein n=1 Tax=Evansella cellulosilytica (strain ATCC 21833 / DSM 2522 / FERM P-1141 / JCM 9156 / N-4) TaxID=649639 RepID=E6TWM7_EVAC2|nr:DUF3048 domain-containing protein [Evansella cellulosilytica]ADU28710.1 hypothetical protein Bcell_0428 [Evansella cellulosilytica DSM 2522]
MKRLILTVFVISLFFLVACKSEEETAKEEPREEEKVEIIESEEPEEEPLPPFPLTGLGSEEGEFEYRAFGVMIENSMSARPQSGLYQADVVYEVLSEGSITRLLAIYHSQQPERIGPVRSARSYYVHLNKGFDAIYASAGGSPGGLQLAESDYVDNISGLVYDGRFFSRSTDRVAPHNMYTTYDDLKAATDHLGYEWERQPPSLYFVDELEENAGEKVDYFEVKYGSTNNDVQYEYDEQLKKYVRYNGGQPTEDLETGEAVAPKNVFIVEMSHRVIPKEENHIDAGSNRREIDVESGGRAYLMQEGTLQEVEWKNVDGIILPFKDDQQVPFLPGQTWVNIVPTNGGGLESYVSLSNNTVD